jgi:hypothetical protein
VLSYSYAGNSTERANVTAGLSRDCAGADSGTSSPTRSSLTVLDASWIAVRETSGFRGGFEAGKVIS